MTPNSRFYHQYDPGKLANVDDIITHFTSAEINSILMEKYGASLIHTAHNDAALPSSSTAKVSTVPCNVETLRVAVYRHTLLQLFNKWSTREFAGSTNLTTTGEICLNFLF